MTADNYEGKWVSVVGGGSSGIGFACAKRLLDAGSQVVLAGIDAEEVASAVAALGGDGEGLLGSTFDARKRLCYR
jgi:NAD(P)-dependent dehydrogenase (short-subunit alcohol dehydrogenase family)